MSEIIRIEEVKEVGIAVTTMGRHTYSMEFSDRIIKHHSEPWIRTEFYPADPIPMDVIESYDFACNEENFKS